MYEHPLFDIRVELSFEMVHLQPLVNYQGWSKAGEFHEFGGILQHAHSRLLQLHKLVLFCFLDGHRINVFLN